MRTGACFTCLHSWTASEPRLLPPARLAGGDDCDPAFPFGAASGRRLSLCTYIYIHLIPPYVHVDAYHIYICTIYRYVSITVVFVLREKYGCSTLYFPSSLVHAQRIHKTICIYITCVHIVFAIIIYNALTYSLYIYFLFEESNMPLFFSYIKMNIYNSLWKIISFFSYFIFTYKCILCYLLLYIYIAYRALIYSLERKTSRLWNWTAITFYLLVILRWWKDYFVHAIRLKKCSISLCELSCERCR